MTAVKVKPALLYKAGATLLLPSQGITPRPLEGKHVCYAGWSFSLALRTSRPKGVAAVLRTLAPAQTRPRALCSSSIATCGCNGIPIDDVDDVASMDVVDVVDVSSL